MQEKEKAQRPAGMSREAFALLDGSHPIVPSLADEMRKKNELQGLKEKRKEHKVTAKFSLWFSNISCSAFVTKPVDADRATSPLCFLHLHCPASEAQDTVEETFKVVLGLRS